MGCSGQGFGWLMLRSHLEIESSIVRRCGEKRLIGKIVYHSSSFYYLLKLSGSGVAALLRAHVVAI